ncbi:MAG: glycogen/starch/alpha-glucan phosphorylase [Lachnospiraceae bacterium]|nr:glycogen/starch/alpha-glucan phosphorylase [Lachnospiraceae bacterium]MDY5742310.1 glycogen/starch/alpha-glucan phosphorylase [Lachnospiraceae bacterium]
MNKEEKKIKARIEQYCNKRLNQCTPQEVFQGLLQMTQAMTAACPRPTGQKKLYYISAEFMIGKLLSNNLINLGIYQEVKEALDAAGFSLAEIEELEAEASLGNGGLGRLAACFLDSIAALDLPGDGIGLNYHLGLFRQKFENNCQNEKPDEWLNGNNWLEKTDVTYPVEMGGQTYQARMYNIQVPGYHGQANALHLFDLDTIDESIVHDGISFDQRDISKCLTLFLYPDDSTHEGRMLRIYQQYLMVSAGAQLIIDEAVAKGSSLHDLADYVVIQINDTHPSMIIPELIRLLTIRGLEQDEAIKIVSSLCAYTNHTILAEALEKWPLADLQEVVPQLVPIIRELDRQIKERYSDPQVAIIDETERVHMAHMDIHYGFSVNGVAALHTDILVKNELQQFAKLYPQKFNNKTNGITFRRWLTHCNPQLTEAISKRIGGSFKANADSLENLLAFADDVEWQQELLHIKRQGKERLTDYLYRTQGIVLNPDSIFDIQIKRLHEYKRQQLNVLHIIRQYLDIKNGKLPRRPLTMIFGAKAAPAYTIAKDIIHLILCLQQLIAEDAEVSKHLQVVMVENYNVTVAEKLIPACDISEQISLASKEASGTGNMKFMLNGAVTLGTEDGANVEIHELVGDDNIFIFGETSEKVIELYATGGYAARQIYEANPRLRESVDFIIGSQLMEIGQADRLHRLHHELVNKDWFMTFLDFDTYEKVKEEAYAAYEDRSAWARKMTVNIAKAGYFSADRTIAEYNRDIWHLTPGIGRNE